jgi:hypothetical protein
MTTTTPQGRLGPQTGPLERLVNQIAVASLPQLRQIGSAFNPEGDNARIIAFGAVRIVYAAACDATLDAALMTVSAVVDALAVDTVNHGLDTRVYDGIYVAGHALACRHFISKDGFTREHYGALTGPVAGVLGPLHPDDTAKEQTR